MQVIDLIRALADQPPTAEVHLGAVESDYVRTETASSVRRVALAEVQWSEYHGTWKVATPQDEDDAPRLSRRVVVIW